MSTFKGNVLGNGFEITERALIIKTGFGFLAKKTTIPLRNIASAEHPKLRNGVKVRTNDGKTYTLVTMHPDDAIAALLG